MKPIATSTDKKNKTSNDEANKKVNEEKKEVNLKREEAIELLKKYNKEEFHLRHALTVEQIMRYFARKYNANEDLWGLSGLLHDVDYEMYPDEHCQKAVELLQEVNADEEIIHAVCSHGYGICSDIEPENLMEKLLFATDELSGLIWACAKMRPSKSTKDMELKSLKKKFKDKNFAAGCSRDIMISGAKQLDWEIDDLLQETLNAMKEIEDNIQTKLDEIL